jgi:hypothetical protein
MHDSTNITGEGESVSNRQARREEFKRSIAILVERFPVCFAADKKAAHRPLKVGIHADLVATGLVTPREVKNTLAVYALTSDVGGDGLTGGNASDRLQLVATKLTDKIVGNVAAPRDFPVSPLPPFRILEQPSDSLAFIFICAA